MVLHYVQVMFLQYTELFIPNSLSIYLGIEWNTFMWRKFKSACIGLHRCVWLAIRGYLLMNLLQIWKLHIYAQSTVNVKTYEV